MEDGKIKGLLSMAQRAGQVVSGDFAAQKALATGKVKLILLATDAAEDTKKMYTRLAARHEVKLCECLTKEELGRCLGKEYRAVAVLLDRGFSEASGKRIQSD